MSLFNRIKPAHNKGQALHEEGTQQLLKGDLGLKITFWGYWFLIMVFINVLLYFTEKRFQILFLNAASIYVGITAIIAIKSTLNGTNKFWGITALIIVSISLFLDVLTLLVNIFEKYFDALLSY